jgi:hypothetical protein
VVTIRYVGGRGAVVKADQGAEPKGAAKLGIQWVFEIKNKYIYIFYALNKL